MTSWPVSITTSMSRSPDCHCTAVMRRSVIPRSWSAVTAVASSARPSGKKKTYKDCGGKAQKFDTGYYKARNATVKLKAPA
ncbi:hypothetical protein GCM10010252_26900 [Streptomyces aureoverticillatus]|nr:hypothetical protein GCM10010252_26900 [Streptomyces aureoverticillatus]